jgi:hypothetical protein
LHATLGGAHVPIDEARLMLGETAADVFAFDAAELTPIADRIGPVMDAILATPDPARFVRGDINKPIAFV